jgi:endonuclease/exonuclease/phosphatase (EEP) superfamily protein YafD
VTFLIWLGALAVLYVAVAPYIPLSRPETDLPSHFVLQAAIGTILLMLAAIVFSVHGKVYMVLLLAYFLCVGKMWPFLLKAKPALADGASLKILQANTWVRNHGMSALKGLIRDEAPDIIAVAEANTPVAALFDELKTDYPHQRVIVRDDCGNGIAVLSKIPLEGLEERRMAGTDRAALFFRIALGGKTVDMVVMHTANPLVNFIERNTELNALAAWYEKEQPPHLIVAGDLNATPYCHILSSVMKRMQLKNARDGRGFLGTFPVRGRVPFLRIPIDHVLVSAAIRVADFRLARDIGSDHRPTISVIKL